MTPPTAENCFLVFLGKGKGRRRVVLGPVDKVLPGEWHVRANRHLKTLVKVYVVKVSKEFPGAEKSIFKGVKCRFGFIGKKRWPEFLQDAEWNKREAKRQEIEKQVMTKRKERMRRLVESHREA